MDTTFRAYWDQKKDETLALLREGEDYLPELQAQAEAIQLSMLLQTLKREIYQTSKTVLTGAAEIAELLETYVDLADVSVAKFAEQIDKTMPDTAQTEQALQHLSPDDFLYDFLKNSLALNRYFSGHFQKQKETHRQVTELNVCLMVSTFQLFAGNAVMIVAPEKSEDAKKVLKKAGSVVLNVIGFTAPLGTAISCYGLLKELMELRELAETVNSGYDEDTKITDQTLAKLEKQLGLLKKIEEYRHQTRATMEKMIDAAREEIRRIEDSMREMDTLTDEDLCRQYDEMMTGLLDSGEATGGLI